MHQDATDGLDEPAREGAQRPALRHQEPDVPADVQPLQPTAGSPVRWGRNYWHNATTTGTMARNFADDRPPPRRGNNLRQGGPEARDDLFFTPYDSFSTSGREGLPDRQVIGRSTSPGTGAIGRAASRHAPDDPCTAGTSETRSRPPSAGERPRPTHAVAESAPGQSGATSSRSPPGGANRSGRHLQPVTSNQPCIAVLVE